MTLGYDLDQTRRVCTRCIYDDRVSAISYGDAVVCNYCQQLDSLVDQYGTKCATGEADFDLIIDKINSLGVPARLLADREQPTDMGENA